MADKAFFAKVHWWDSRTVHVQCPFCMKIHTHGFGKSYESVHRAAHCDSRAQLSYPSYEFKYPFSQIPETTAYEIDKTNRRFVALDADPPQPEPDLLEEGFANLALNQKPAVALERWKDAVETITIDRTDTILRRLQEAFGGDETFTMKRIDHVSSQMICFGAANYVREYLDSSPESRIFLHGVDDDGNSALWSAACERFPVVVELLLDRGANADFQNKNGRTPLMEAALWGRCENVKHLLRYGADKNLQDGDGFKAIHLADSSDRNEEERYWRSGEEHQVYKEVTRTANQARRMIVHLLEDAIDETIPGPNNNFENHVFQKSLPGTIKLVAPIAEYPISRPWKTIARLERGNKYPSVAAMSGWSHGDTITTVSGRDWTSEVIRIAEIIGHILQPDERRDRGVPGQFYACHAEKQLIAYFISRHVFLEPEIRAPKKRRYTMDPQYLTTKDLVEAFRRKAELESDEGGPLRQLATAMPPVMLKQATILVSSPPCQDCTLFKDLVNLSLGLNIPLLNCSEVR